MKLEERLIALVDDTLAFMKTGFMNTGSMNTKDMKSGTMHSEYRDAKSGAVGLEGSAVPKDGESIPYDREIDETIRRCTRCRLHETRRNAVPGTGNTTADILIVGEGPGAQEDAQGLPFVGKAGQLLTKMLAAIDLKRENLYITNIVKCRPPGNRNPLPDEVDACFPYLERQIAMIHPRVIVCLGGPAAKTLLRSELGITRLRGQFHRYVDIPVLATYHPAAVLRFPEKYKRDAWNDLKLLRDFYEDMRS
jgi:DNA polymerase